MQRYIAQKKQVKQKSAGVVQGLQ